MIVDDIKVYKLSNIIRYSTQTRIKNENVAEHSFYVMWFIERLCTKYNICDSIKLKALEAGLFHDVPEAITNDITYDVKNMVDGLSDLLKPFEKAIIGEHNKNAYEVLFNPEQSLENEIAKALVDYADVLSVYQYCKNETSLGNTNFISMTKGSEVRLKKAKDHLEKMIKKMEEEKDAEK